MISTPITAIVNPDAMIVKSISGVGVIFKKTIGKVTAHMNKIRYNAIKYK